MMVSSVSLALEVLVHDMKGYSAIVSENTVVIHFKKFYTDR